MPLKYGREMPCLLVRFSEAYHVQAIGSDEVDNVYEAVKGTVRGDVVVACVVCKGRCGRQVGKPGSIGERD